MQVAGKSTSLILLRHDEPAEQSRSGCFGLRAIRDLCRQQRPRFRKLAACFMPAPCRRCRVLQREIWRDAVQRSADGPPRHTRAYPPRSGARESSSWRLWCFRPDGSTAGVTVTEPCRFACSRSVRANAGARSARTEHGGEVETHCLLARPPEQLLGADVPRRDDPLRIQRDESMIGKTLDGETKNVLGDEVCGRSSRSLSHGTIRIGYATVHR